METWGFSTEDDEFVNSVYVLEGKVFSISKESQETVKMLSEQIREALPDTEQRATDMAKQSVQRRPRHEFQISFHEFLRASNAY